MNHLSLLAVLLIVTGGAAGLLVVLGGAASVDELVCKGIDVGGIILHDAVGLDLVDLVLDLVQLLHDALLEMASLGLGLFSQRLGLGLDALRNVLGNVLGVVGVLGCGCSGLCMLVVI